MCVVVEAHERVSQSVDDVCAGWCVVRAVRLGERAGDDVSAYLGYCAGVGWVGVVRAE
jgi:hypothetical protein